jgi:hypothetical protein
VKIQISLSASYHRGEVYYDQVNGKGAIPHNQEIDHKGIRVMMRPTKFLELCYPLRKGQAEATNFDFLKDYIKGGNPIGSPWLRVEMERIGPGEYDMKNAYISGHEGRNRALAILELYGDDPIEVHITTSMDNNRYFTKEMRAALREEVKSQTGHRVYNLWKQEL